jgi:phosphoribosylamine-glycine ligase
VTLVDEGYPERAVWRDPRARGVSGPDRFAFYASGRRTATGWEVAGGRAVHLVARAADRDTARALVYDGIDRLSGTGWRCRRDIAASGAAGSDAAHDFGATAGLRS